jgi:error-prone DNA polymerase
MVAGFAGFGFPKAHGAAFGLLAYQSTWLRVHYGPEFLCALLNEQPMGFYAPDSLVHEAEVRGIAVLGLDVNASHVQCTVEDARGRLGVRLGLGYIKGVVAAEAAELVAERERHGPFRSLGQMAARVGAGRSTLEQLAWSGACDSLVQMDGAAVQGAGSAGWEAGSAGWEAGSAGWGAGSAGGQSGSADARRRLALWQIGIPTRPAAPGRTADGETQLALPLEMPPAPRLRPLSRWQRLLADYATSGVTVGDHVMAALRPRLQAPMLATSAQLSRLPQGCSVAVAGLVIARQRPGTAKGTMFLLFEDEWGTINLIVPRKVYEAQRPLARAEPLLLARGRLERSQEGVLNVIVRELAALEGFVEAEGASGDAPLYFLPSSRFAGAEGEGEDGAEMGAGMRAVAPPVQSFAAGRRR